MGIVLDSSVLINLERNGLLLDELAGIVDDKEELFISVVTASELLHGVYRASTKSSRLKRSSFVEAIFEQIPVIQIDIRVARSHALIWSELAKNGTMIGMNDSWIAASCIAHNLKLATFDYQDFKKVEGLSIIRAEN